MIEHFEEHPHAFIKDGIVVWVGVFDGHDEQFLETLKPLFEADTIICCCNIGFVPAYGFTWDGTRFANPLDNTVQN